MTWLIIIGVVLLIAFIIGEEGDMADYPTEDLIDELNDRHE